VYFGFDKRVDPQTLQLHIAGGGEIINLIQEADAEAGDVFLIRPGTVHGYGAGLIYFELQQNSDITYRLYDWNRVDSSGKPRELHIQKGLQVMDYDVVKPKKIQPVCLKEGVEEHCFLTASKKFLVEYLDLSKSYSANTEEESFHMLCVTGGAAKLVSDSQYDPEINLGLGDVVLIPASVNEYQLVPQPRCKVLRCRLPDLQKDVLDYLSARGVSTESILGLGGSAGKNDY